jgi:hypothetical protein
MRVFIGWDPHEMAASVVADYSLKAHARGSYPESRRLTLLELRHRQLYTRPTILWPDGKTLWDEISDAPMSTEHAISRFFIPLLCGYQGWALFVDGDVLFRQDVAALFALADPTYAVQVVQHPPLLAGGTKKAGQAQQPYPRKNWSSVMLFNCGHEANRALTLDVLNSWPGRDLHAFRWLDDDVVGVLPADWNHLVNVSAPSESVALAHFTLGTPNLPGHEADPYADEWFAVAKRAGYYFPTRTIGEVSA